MYFWGVCFPRLSHLFFFAQTLFTALTLLCSCVSLKPVICHRSWLLGAGSRWTRVCSCQGLDMCTRMAKHLPVEESCICPNKICQQSRGLEQGLCWSCCNAHKAGTWSLSLGWFAPVYGAHSWARKGTKGESAGGATAGLEWFQKFLALSCGMGICKSIRMSGEFQEISRRAGAKGRCLISNWHRREKAEDSQPLVGCSFSSHIPGIFILTGALASLAFTFIHGTVSNNFFLL